MNLLKLHNQITKVCPIDGVSIGIESDKRTWRIQFKSEATEAQKQEAQGILEAFDSNDITLGQLTQGYIMKLNTLYPSLNLVITDTMDEAKIKMTNEGVSFEEAVTLMYLYEKGL